MDDWCVHGYAILDGESNCRECAHAREVAELRKRVEIQKAAIEEANGDCAKYVTDLIAERAAHAATKAKLAEIEQRFRSFVADHEPWCERGECDCGADERLRDKGTK